MSNTAMQEQDYEKDVKVDFSIWKRLLSYVFRYKKTAIALMLCNVGIAVIDILYPLMSQYAIDNFVEKGTTAGIGWFIALYIAFIALQALGVYSFIVKAGKLEMSVSYDMRREAFQKLQELSFSFYDRTAVGYLMARMISDVGSLSEMMAWSFVDLLWASTYVIGVVIAMFAMNWKLALLIMIVIPPLAVISVFFQKKILKYQRRVRKTNSRITGAFNEGIMGAMTTKTLVREDANYSEFKQLSSEMKRDSIRSALLSALFMPIVMFLGSIGTAIALHRGGIDVMGGIITFGTLSAFISYATNFFEPIQQLAGILAEMQSAQASAERVVSLIDTPCEIVDSPEVVAKYGDSFNPRRENWEPIKGDVDFEHVSFAYKEGEKVLKDFNLHVKAGETIALVGETGAGKSTIVNLVCRFYEPTEGRVLIDGRDYRERSQLWLHSNLGYVLQSPHLFSGSIADNIRYGKLDATGEEIIAAAKAVHAHDFIMDLKDGYDTMLTERGGGLSVGQKQLLAFARTMISNPNILILDEATSSIDTQTELLVQEGIDALLKGRTSFVIAHRLSTIQKADRIFVIDHGGIVEEGSAGELLAKKGAYYRLHNAQLKFS